MAVVAKCSMFSARPVGFVLSVTGNDGSQSEHAESWVAQQVVTHTLARRMHRDRRIARSTGG
jgi:hypothetical protein